MIQRNLAAAAVALVVGASAAVAPTVATAAESGSISPASANADPDAYNCYVNVDSPHYSSGAAGVIAKPRWSCGSLATRTVTSWIGNLYRCSRQPAAGTVERDWTATYGCSAVRSASETADFVVAGGKTITRYIPLTGTGATPGGYFIACVRGYYSTGTAFAKPSLPAYVP